jgi:hypothetical protein
MTRGHEHAYQADILCREEEEFQLADCLLCPSDFAAQPFLEQWFSPEKLSRHQYGFDGKKYYPNNQPHDLYRGLAMRSMSAAVLSGKDNTMLWRHGWHLRKRPVNPVW